MRLRLDLDPETSEALARDAGRNLRPLVWQVEWILREHLGTHPWQCVESAEESEDDDAVQIGSPTSLPLDETSEDSEVVEQEVRQ